MIEAILKKKVALSEDVLTSVAFGALKACSPAAVAELVARRCESVTGNQLRPDLSGDLEWCFWPTWNGDEPDLVISNADHLCVIEVKWGASFGEDRGRGRQLEKYWRAAKRRSSTKKQTVWLIALTTDPTMPVDKIRQQLRTVKETDLDYVMWLGWTDVYEYMQGLRPDNPAGINDALAVLRMADLGGFEGFGSALELARESDSTTWRFEEGGMNDGNGERLGHALMVHRDFMHSCFKLFLAVNSELTAHGWNLAGNDGSYTWRNGRSHNLTQFDWTADHTTAVFVEMDPSEARVGKSVVPDSSPGMPLIAVQVRWGDRPQMEPMVWVTKLWVRAKAPDLSLRVCLTNLCDELGRASGAEGGRASGEVSGESTKWQFRGSYTAVPVSDIRGRSEVAARIAKPALGPWPSTS